MTRLDYLFRQYDTLLGWYRQAEEKARFIVGLNTLVAGAVNGMVFVGTDPSQAVRASYPAPLWWLLGFAGTVLVASFLYVLRAMWPRHHADASALAPQERLWFFGDIAAMRADAHRQAMDGWTAAQLEASLVAQNWILSRNVWRKYEALNRATVCTVVALVLLFGLGIAYAVLVVPTPA